MLKNYLLVSIRNFRRQGLFSFINVAGLAIGLACTLFIFLWVSDELNKDRYHSDIKRIYQIVCNISNSEGVITWDVTPGPLAEEIKSSIPEVEFVAPVANDGPRLVQINEKNYLPEGYFTYPDFFRIFDFNILEGDKSNPLPDPASVVLTKSLATKLFGNESAIGKVIKVRTENDLKVTAVIDDVPSNSTFEFEFIAHFDIHKKYRPQEWGNSDYPLYIKFHKDFNAIQAQEKINNHVAKTLELTPEESKRFQFYLQPYAERYLYSMYENGHPVSGRIKYVRIFSIVAIFILVVACINFMNLATARASVRHKEVGVRKVIGAQRRLIMTQFLSESILTAFLSMIVALFLAEVCMPYFNTLVSKQLSIHYTDPAFFVPVIVIVLFSGILAGIYPAFVLAGVNPARVLKGTVTNRAQGINLRRALVVFQFAISVVLIVSSLVVSKQIRFIQSKNLGYNKENVLTMPARGIKDTQLFKEQLAAIPGVSQVSLANENITHVNNQNSSFSWPGKPEGQQLYVRTIVVGYDFIETMGLKIVSGRSFFQEHNDTSNVIINQKLASLMNVENPIGMDTKQWGREGKIVGIAEDFHIRSISESIDPVVILCRPDWTGTYYVRIEGDKVSETVARLQQTWKNATSLYPFEYSFLDESFNRLYRQEEVISTLTTIFTTLAIVISALGLLGLATYATERKKKELSIRKVLGATVGNLIMLMSTEFMMLTAIALFIGCPLAYYLMEQFLSGYAYHVSPGYDVFVFTTIGLFVTTLLVISFQLVRAAVGNPVDNLRNE